MHNTKHIENTKIVKNQFGEFSINLDRKINLPSGLIGMSQANNFVLLASPLQNFKDFYILQSVEFDDLAILLQPINLESPIYHDAKDLEDVLLHIGFKKESVSILVVVAAKMEGEQRILTVNTRAPIFIETDRMLAAQFVLPNPNYDIQHPIKR